MRACVCEGVGGGVGGRGVCRLVGTSARSAGPPPAAAPPPPPCAPCPCQSPPACENHPQTASPVSEKSRRAAPAGRPARPPSPPPSPRAATARRHPHRPVCPRVSVSDGESGGALTTSRQRAGARPPLAGCSWRGAPAPHTRSRRPVGSQHDGASEWGERTARFYARHARAGAPSAPSAHSALTCPFSTPPPHALPPWCTLPCLSHLHGVVCSTAGTPGTRGLQPARRRTGCGRPHPRL